jgi:hypothetical protein
MSRGPHAGWAGKDDALGYAASIDKKFWDFPDYEGRIIWVNANTERMFSYSRDELINKSKFWRRIGSGPAIRNTVEASRFAGNLADAAHLVEPVILKPLVLADPADDIALYGGRRQGRHSMYPEHKTFFLALRRGIVQRTRSEGFRRIVQQPGRSGMKLSLRCLPSSRPVTSVPPRRTPSAARGRPPCRSRARSSKPHLRSKSRAGGNRRSGPRRSSM